MQKPHLNVLLIDDDEDEFIITQDLLSEIEGSRFELDWVSNYEAALQEIAKAAHDVYLVDYRLGQFDGLQLIRAAIAQGCVAPLILLTGQGARQVDLEAMQAGAADYLVKGQIDALLLERSIRYATQRKQAEEDLRKSEQKYRTLIERMNEGILQLDNRQVIQFVNDRFCQIVGYDKEELLGQVATKLFLVDEDQDFVAEKIDLRACGISDQYELRLKKKSGEVIWTHISASPIIDAAGNPIGTIGIHTDITEQKMAAAIREDLEDQLRQSQKMEAIGRLAGGVAHDFNNLLTAILGYSGIALRQLKPHEQAYLDIQEIRKTAQRAANLTHQLLAFAHRQVIEPQIINLNNLIINLDKMLRRLITANIELIILPDPDLGEVKADPGGMEQVLVNLVVNACDAMPEGGKLTIETANITLTEDYARRHPQVKAGPYIQLIVSDTGMGMPDEVQKHIFEPFFTTKEAGKGTGLGLATCFGIVKQSNGHITVESSSDLGAKFKIYLPRVEEDVVFKADKLDDTVLPIGAETILMAEDELSVQNLAARVLRSQGYTVLTASNGGEALRIASRPDTPHIHLLFTDIVMPQLGGRELAEQLKPKFPHLKILFTTGYTDDLSVYRSDAERGTGFLQKPYTPDSLIQKVREILDS